MKGSRGSGGGEAAAGERLCWCITLYTSYILIGSAMFKYFFPLLQLLTCILWSRLTDWCTHSNQVFLPEQIFPTGKIKINKMNVKSLQTDWTSDNAITPKIVCFSSRIFHEDLGQYLSKSDTTLDPKCLRDSRTEGSRIDSRVQVHVCPRDVGYNPHVVTTIKRSSSCQYKLVNSKKLQLKKILWFVSKSTNRFNEWSDF